MSEFKENIDRDATLLAAGARGGYISVCACALILSLGDFPEMKGGPDTVTKHGVWFNAQPDTYKDKVAARVTDLLFDAHAHGIKRANERKGRDAL